MKYRTFTTTDIPVNQSHVKITFIFTLGFFPTKMSLAVH